jgi:hypothetical protein
MKKILLAALAIGSIGLAKAQTFSDNFDSYTAGDYVAKQSGGKWTTWANAPGTAQDAKVSSAKAHSGSNSVYLNSTLTGGGPTDLLLPFGQADSMGHFTFEFWSYITAGHGGYMNFQGHTNSGDIWTAQMTLTSAGTYSIDNTMDGILLGGNYAHNTWNDFKFDVNLNTGTWNLYINNSLQGTFHSSILSVASADFYANAGEDMYLDDVSYSLTGYTLPNLNAALMSLNNVEKGIQGLKETPSVTIRNMGLSTITSLEISFVYNGQTITNTLSGLSINKLEVATFNLPNQITLAGGNNMGVVTITKVNGVADDDNTDNTLNTTITGVVPADHRVVIVEEGTGTWCQWCPRGQVFMQMMTDKYYPSFQGIAVHDAISQYPDPMQVPAYDKAISNVIATHKDVHTGQSLGFPTVYIDRTVTTDPSEMEQDILNDLDKQPVAYMVNGASYDATTKLLKVSLTSHFQRDTIGTNLRLACVLAEDNVTGTSTYYAQQNAYGNNAHGPMGGFENFPTVVPANKMVYDHVARAIEPSFGGATGQYAATVSSGSTVTSDFTFDLSSSTIKVNDVNKLHIVGLLIGADGRIVNGSTYSFADAVTNGYVEGNMVEGIKTIDGPVNISVYPNPASNQLTVSCTVSGNAIMTLTDITGKKVISSETKFNGQTVTIPTDGLSNGIYLLNITNGENSYSTKVMIAK